MSSAYTSCTALLRVQRAQLECCTQDILDLEVRSGHHSDPKGIPDRLVVHRKGIVPSQGLDSLAYSLHTSSKTRQVLGVLPDCYRQARPCLLCCLAGKQAAPQRLLNLLQALRMTAEAHCSFCESVFIQQGDQQSCCLQAEQLRAVALRVREKFHVQPLQRLQGQPDMQDPSQPEDKLEPHQLPSRLPCLDFRLVWRPPADEQDTQVLP